MLIDSRKRRFVTEYGATPHGINLEAFLLGLPCKKKIDISDHSLEGLEFIYVLIRMLRLMQYREIRLCHLLR